MVLSATVMSQYEAVPGFFIQDEPSAAPRKIGALPPHFGLALNSWAELRERVAQLNSSAPPNESYKVFFFGRHGQGYHNLAMEKHGFKAWDDHWSMQAGDGELVWGPDAELTALGEMQAKEAAMMWNVEVSRGIPFPQAFYCSPLTRAIQTYLLTFTHLGIPNLPKALILENCREKYGEHPCDKRRTRSYLLNFHETLSIEDGLAEEEDELWQLGEVHINPNEALPVPVGRARSVLDHIFATNKQETYISVTAHAGIINGFLHVAGRSSYALPTAGILPVVIRQIRV